MSDSQSDNGQPDGTLIDSISQAIRENDTHTLLQLLKKRKRNPIPLPADNRGWTALHVAASKPQYKDCLELLFKYRNSIIMDIDGQTDRWKTALSIASENGCEENVEILLQNGCDPYFKGIDTPLTVAAREGHFKIVKSLLNYPENINEQVFGEGTALLFAVWHGHSEICRILLENGADVRLKHHHESLPLHFACRSNYFDIARLLVENDPTTINLKNALGKTPLILALDGYGRRFEYERRLEFVRFLLENGASTDTCDISGKMALHYVACHGNVELLQLILQHTDASTIDRCLSSTTAVLKYSYTSFSLTCGTIASKSVECLEVLISSSKISKSILETPDVDQVNGYTRVYSPLAFLFKRSFKHELLNSYLQLLLKHKLMMLDEYFAKCQVKWPTRLRFVHPFSYILGYPASEQLHFFNLLNSNCIDMDYCLKCYHDNSQPFSTFSDYKCYYGPLKSALFSTLEEAGDRKLEVAKLLMSNSVILEPDLVCVTFYRIPHKFKNAEPLMLKYLEELRELFQYFISLKPVYFTQFQLHSPDIQTDLSRFPYSTIEEEFSRSTLKQLCRTVIRHQLRDYTLEDNLRNFRRKVMELPLPTSVKDYLLFKE